MTTKTNKRKKVGQKYKGQKIAIVRYSTITSSWVYILEDGSRVR
jgi:hypothetical protein